jgi:nucleoid-associated protein YgaU
VDSFDEAIYTPQAGDTFPSIAAKYYGGAEAYGPALLWYNRNHPDAGDGIRQEPPVLTGQRVYVPLEKRVLEQRYPKLIPGLATAVAPLAPAAPIAPPPAPVAAAPTYPQYRVTQKEGESMFAIAQRTLGNGFRWKEIAALNPSLTSEFAVEADKVLRLPPDAHVDADHVPR